MSTEPHCPDCGGILSVVWRLVVAPLGSFSLAGVVTKVSATDTPFLVCSCGFEKAGKR